jgi:hypothetical protein
MALLPAESVAVDMRKVPAWKKAAEFVRGLVVAFVVASFVAAAWNCRLEGGTAARSRGVDWVSFHDSYGLGPVGQPTLEIRCDPFG